MGKFLTIIALGISQMLLGQAALYNNGAIRLHDNGTIGFHTDLINDGDFNNTAGLIGFYGNQANIVSGIAEPTFFDIEFANSIGTFLQVDINVANNVNFVSGNVLTPRNFALSNLNFLSEAFFVGEADNTKVFGFASISDKSSFTFPVGDADQLRSLVLNSSSSNNFAQCAYYSEDPANPVSIEQSFNPEAKSTTIGEISSQEFWILTGDASSNVTLSWNLRSNLNGIALELADVIVVGWSKASNQWINLGNVTLGGDLNEGFVTSTDFVPNDFEVLTFAAAPLPLDNFALNNPTLGNYFVSPNGDGVNDVLIIDNLDASPNNTVLIFNRLGQKVFEQSNYVNEFGGVANTNGFIPNREIGLPEGIYYYTATLFDLDLQYSGFLFLDR